MSRVNWMRISTRVLRGQEEQTLRVCCKGRVQEMNITYPMDTKLQKKIVEKCRENAKDEGIVSVKSIKTWEMFPSNPY